MIELNQYTLKTKHQGVEVIYNTVTKRYAHPDADEDLLRQNFFLYGQEIEAVKENLLYNNRDTFQLKVVPTWECNLRCKHCCVLTILEKKDEYTINKEQFAAFVEDYLYKVKPKSVSLDLLGGEPLLRGDECLAIVNQVKTITDNHKIKLNPCITTNLTIDLTDNMLDLFDRCDWIGVSIDGNKEEHNWQRVPLNKSDDPYEKTIYNLKELAAYGFAGKIKIKAAVREKFMTEENYEKFLFTMAEIGIPLDNIDYGGVYPTDHHFALQDIALVKERLKQVQLNTKPCCKFRIMSEYWVQPNGDIYDIGFAYARHKVGHISESVDAILERRKSLVFSEFPCFKDKGCSNCPVIGYCWGGCVNNNTLVKNNPSKFCNRQGLIELVSKLAEKGNLIESDNELVRNIL